MYDCRCRVGHTTGSQWRLESRILADKCLQWWHETHCNLCMLAADVPCRREFAYSRQDWTNEVANVVAMQSDNAGRIWRNALVWKCIDLQWWDVLVECEISIESHTQGFMLSEKGIWEPTIVGVETKEKLRRRCRVPNKMDSNLLLLSARQLYRADKQEERRVKCAVTSAVVKAM